MRNLVFFFIALFSLFYFSSPYLLQAEEVRQQNSDKVIVEQVGDELENEENSSKEAIDSVENKENKAHESDNFKEEEQFIKNQEGKKALTEQEKTIEENSDETKPKLNDESINKNNSTETIKQEETKDITLEKGIYHEDVIDLKINLGEIGFLVSKIPNTYYGPITEKVVKDFQKYYGVNDEPGVAGRATLNKIGELLSSPLQNGKYNEATITLKKNLAKIGYKVPGNTTTHYGPLTEETVKKFQKKYGLVENGIADERTLAKI
ncbi:hypothetical protein CAI16_20350, partial [Virgibacillus dokdonensis]